MVLSVPGSSREGDLVLYYRTSPDRCVRNLHRIVGRVVMDTRNHSGTRDRMAPIRKVCELASPLHLSELKQHRVLKSANFVRANVRGRYSVTQHWPELYEAITSRNPSVRRSLKAWQPGALLG